MDRLDERAVARVRGEAWDKIRPQLAEIHNVLVSVSPSASGELTTIYVKYSSAETGPQPFAVLWIKKSTELVLGLALPADFIIQSSNRMATSMKYNGLTVYLRFTADDEIPPELRDWAAAAYRNLLPV